MKIGVLALQGGFSEHVIMLRSLCESRGGDFGGEKLTHEVCEVRTAEDLSTCDGLVIPGGESTVMMQFIEEFGLEPEIRRLCEEGIVYGTCAGLIVLSKLGLLNVKVERNAYGRQLSSFITDLMVRKPGASEGEAVSMPVGHFIRAPKIVSMGEGVEILAEYEGAAVLVHARGERGGQLFAGAFHPELSDCTAIHEMIFFE
jgi:5'-phosphate synthase pdxT subunit